jgi:SAM-dependent methyltransferase
MQRRNLWKSKRVAVAYFYQQQARPYIELLEATEKYIHPKPYERWLDLGCGSGRLLRSIWEKSHGEVASIIGIDISFAGLLYAKELIGSLERPPPAGRISVVQADFNGNLAMLFRPGVFDGITAGLSICYADHWDRDLGKWGNQAYARLLLDIYTILKKGGSFIFSSCVPDPSFSRIALASWRELFLTWKAPVHLLAGMAMFIHAQWVRKCVRQGRYHFPPIEFLLNLLHEIGFSYVEYQRTYANQAWVFYVIK